MSIERRTDYLWSQILCHLRLFFDDRVVANVDRDMVTFGPYADLIALRKRIVAIPNDIPYEITAVDAWQVPFNSTTLTVWNRLRLPNSDGWRAEPNDAAPLWYVHDSGTHIPAWNLFGNLLALLTSEEERADPARDQHGRYVGAQSPRDRHRLLLVPAFNEAVAALAAACVGLRNSGRADYNLDGMLTPPVVILSHDCDILRGNDRWTQSIRAARIFLPLFKLRLPRLANPWWIIRNYMRPHDFYFDNVFGMINLERQFGFTSTFYLLNGSAGRFGARSGSNILPELIASVPEEWPLGIHYNYDTYLNQDAFLAQQSELTTLISHQPVLGRAHYLRYDTYRSPAFLAAHGIQCDESVGFSDRVSYRCGIGGCFQLYDCASESAVNLWEIPMNIMEDTLQLQFGDSAVDQFEKMLQHLGRIGGALSLNVHPGVFFNPETPRMLGFYHALLRVCRNCGAVGMSAARLLDRIPPNLQSVK